jgi:hypothetical protein
VLTLKREYATEGDVPAEVKALYKEQDGKLVLDATIEGMRTTEDVNRVQTALQAERTAHQETKNKLSALPAELNVETLQADLDELAELRASKDAKGGKLSEDQIEDIVNRRIARQLGPVERERDQLKSRLTEVEGERDNLRGTIQTGNLHSELRRAAIAAKVADTAIEDVLIFGEREFQFDADGVIAPKDGSKLAAGTTPAEWLEGLREAKPHLFPLSTGSGARGAGGGAGGKNPWSKEGWNLTEQGKIITEKGEEHAKRLAESVNSYIGATSAPA